MDGRDARRRRGGIRAGGPFQFPTSEVILLRTRTTALPNAYAVGVERQLISSGSPYEATVGFSRAVRVGDRVLVSGTAPIWPDGSCDPDAGVQAGRCLEIILAALAQAGAGPEQVVRTRSYLVDPVDAAAVSRAHGLIFGDVRPASTMIVVAGLLDPRWKIEMEAEAVLDSVD